MSAKGVWIAFGLGVSAGAAVALLYAPQAGEKTRRQIKRNINDGVDYLEDAADYLKEQADYLARKRGGQSSAPAARWKTWSKKPAVWSMTR